MSRGSLDSVLARHAQSAGAELRDGASAEVTPGDGCECVRVQHMGAEAEVHARVVIVADGLGGSSLRRYPGFSWRTTRASRIGLGAVLHTGIVHVAGGALHMHVGRDGYVGMVRLEDGLVDVAAAVDPRALRTHGPGVVVAEVLRTCGAQADWASSVRWHGTPPLTRRRERVAQTGVFVVGDAAGYVEPFTGEGMAWAVGAGAGVTKHCLAWMTGDADAPARWEREYHRLVRGNQRACRALSWLVRRPRVAACGIGLVGLVPDASGLVRWALSPRNATAEAAPWTR
jgi:flavin-dependent dehydrogenase